RPARAVAGAHHEHDEDRDQGQPRDRQGVWQLRERCLHKGRIRGPPRILCRVAELPRIPGFVDAHSHAFQRALRGRAEGGDFWAWRELMLELAGAQTPESVRADYEATYAEMRAAGYTAVGEFHYLGEPEARSAVEAARPAGIELVLLVAAY